MKHLNFKRLLSMALVLVLLLTCMPSVVLWDVQAAENQAETKAVSNRKTMYFSTSGSDSNSGTSESRPKKDITKISTYLAQGYNVMLKRGDTWYLPTNSIKLQDLAGTEEDPLIIGAYGDSSNPMPTIAFMHDFTQKNWTLVDAEKNIYSLDISSLAVKNGKRLHRAFVDGKAYFNALVTDYNELEAEEFCDYNGIAYFRTNGGAPANVEATPYGWGAIRLNIQNVSYLTMENLHIKGGNSLNPLIKLNAPSNNFKFTNCDVTHTFYYIFQMESVSEAINYNPEVSYCYFDTMYNEKEGFVNNGEGSVAGGANHWNTTLTEGITMRDGVDGAWIHHNTFRQMGHAFIAIENLDRHEETKSDGTTGQGYLITGVHNCIIEDNLLEGGNSCYARAFNICGGFNLNGKNLCTNNVYRRNQVYDMTTSSHLNGEYNLIYSNVFSYAHCEYNENGEIFDGKTAQPWAFDSILWSDYTCKNNIVANNTFYDMGGAWAIYNQNSKIYGNLFVNNLVVNYTDDHGDYMGGLHDRTNGYNMAMNNGFFSGNKQDHIVIDGVPYTAENANSVSGFSGNLSGDPIFLTADLSIINQRWARQDFSLSASSPYRSAGLSLDASVYRQYSTAGWKNIVSILKSDYTDVNGNAFDPDAPSIGAITYTASTGASIESVTANTTPLLIAAGFPQIVGSNWESVLGLATSAKVHLSDGRTGNVAIRWDYSVIRDWNTIGQYKLTGVLSTDDFSNPKGLSVSQTILITPCENLLYNSSFEMSSTSLTGWAGSGNKVNTNALGVSDGKVSLLKTIKDGINDADYNILYQNGHNSNPATSTNYADLLAKAVAKKGAGTYYMSVDAKSAASSLTSDYYFYLRLNYKNAYTDASAISIASSAKTLLPLVNQGFATSSLIFDMSGEYNWLRSNVYLAGPAGTLSGQSLYIDNLKLICLRQELTNCEHTWAAATCTVPKTCTICGATEGSALAHTAKAAAKENVVAATCAGTGSYDAVVRCAVCNYEISRQTISTPATGNHSYVNGICSVCGDIASVYITEITTKTPALAIISGFKNYVGSDWQSVLALVPEATVALSDGTSATIPVIWDYSPLGDLTKIGTYVLTGELDSSDYANIKGLVMHQSVVIREHSNLLHNPSFEEGSKANTGWGGGGTSAKNTTAAHITHGASSLYKVTPTITGTRTTYQLAYQNAHDKDPASYANYAVMLADAVKAQGAGLYYISIDAKGATDTMGDDYMVYVNFLSKDIYNGTSTTIGTTSQKILNPIGGSFVTSSGLFALSGTDNWLRTDIYLKGPSGMMTGVSLYLDNAQLLLVRAELIEEPSVSHNVVDGICTICGKYGTCGANLTWELDDNGTLTISGTDAMNDYASLAAVPWAALREDILRVVVEDGVTSIGTYAFNSCYNLTSVTIASSVKSFASGAFEYSSKLSEVYIADLKAWCEASFGSNSSTPLFYADKLYVNDKLVADLVIPEGTAYISAYAFYDYDGLTSLTIPSTVVTIGEKAFYGCLVLTGVAMPYGVTTIDTYAFAYCTKLAQVLLPTELASIESNAFNGCTVLKDVYYRGNAEQWAAIAIKSNNTKITGSALLLNYAGTTLPKICAHTWQDATCTVPKTCTACGAITGVIPQGHAYDNDSDASCNNCGEIREVGPIKDSNLNFLAAPGLSFQDYIGMQVLVPNTTANKYDRIWVEAVQADPAGDVTATLEAVPYFGVYQLFEQQILSWSMTEEVTLTLYAQKDGKTYVGQTVSASVEKLALDKITSYDKAGNAKAVKALVDMLGYGAAVQVAFNHNASNLPNKDLGDYADKGTTTTPEFNASNNKTGTGKVSVLKDSISMQAKVEVQLLFAVDISAYTVKATVGGEDAPVVIDTETMGAYGWTLVRVAIGAAKMRDNYTIALYDAEGNAVTQVYEVSVEAYGAPQLGGTYNDVVIAMMRYGDSVAAI